jgi:general nucleoside transport system permease protein
MSTALANLRSPTSSDGPAAYGPRTYSRAKWLGIAGIALGILAFFVAIPPITLRTVAPSWVLAVGGVALGVAAIRGGERRVGSGAVVAAAIGALGAYGATRSGVGNLETVVSWGALAASMLRYATPLTLAALGGLVSERSGVVNIGLEGGILMGAFFGALGADKTGSWLLGLLIGVLAGCAIGLVHAVFCVSLRADQIVVGTALNFIAAGLTGYLFIDTYSDQGTPDNLPGIPAVSLPIKSVPFFGDALGNQNLMVWLSLFAVLAVWVIVFKTAMGLGLRSVGESPRAADTVGIPVYRTRYLAVIASGGLSAAGGAFLSIGFVNSFTQGMSAGRGFIALAALIFGRWRPGGLLAATLLFGGSSALAQRLPAFNESTATLLQALPYVLTLVAVAGVVGRSVPPAADGVPYEKDH